LPPQQHELQCHGLLISCNRTAAAQEKSSPSLLSPPVLKAKQKHSRKSDFPQSMQHENESRENDEANTTKTQEDNQRNKTPAQTHNNPQSNKLNATTTTTTTKTAPVVATKKKKKNTNKEPTETATNNNRSNTKCSKTRDFHKHELCKSNSSMSHTFFLLCGFSYLPTYLPTYLLASYYWLYLPGV
jgi:cell division protein FtsN